MYMNLYDFRNHNVNTCVLIISSFEITHLITPYTSFSFVFLLKRLVSRDVIPSMDTAMSPENACKYYPTFVRIMMMQINYHPAFSP